MIDMNEVQSATETLARAFEEYKSVNDTRLGEIENRGSADVLLTEKLGRMDQSMNSLQDEIVRVKTALRRPSMSFDGCADNRDEETESQQYRQVPQHAESHHHHHFRRIHDPARSLTQRADEDDGHHDGDQDHQRRTESPCQLLADGRME